MWPITLRLPMASRLWLSTGVRRSWQHQAWCSSASDAPKQRRSANYEPSSWNYGELLSLKGVGHDLVRPSGYDKLKGGIKDLLLNKAEPVSKLHLIDMMQRLGISYHFEEEISDILNFISMDSANAQHMNNDIASSALKFRLLRENGFPTTAGQLSSRENYIKMTTQKDVNGLLSLYEASYHAIRGEQILDVARTFSANTLKELRPSMLPHLRKLVEHTLELPLHWRAPRLEARWFISYYAGDISMCPMLLQFARLDFNMVQAVHQEDLVTVTMWWRDNKLGDKLKFARDRLMECFHYANGIVWEPNLRMCRQILTKISCLIIYLDDVYDVYGTMDELVVFTDAVGRWDAKPSDTLPEYMQALYSVIYKTSNEVEEHTLKEHGCSTHNLLQRAWHGICMSFLVEAKWQHGNSIPSLQEYLENGRVSCSGPLLLFHAFPMLNLVVNTMALAQIKSYPRLVQSASLILRLCNDSATHSAELQRGDAPSSIAIHMSQNTASEQDSRKAMQDLILDAWKTVNEEAFENFHFSRPFIKACVNLARISHCVYHGGDGFGTPNGQKRKQIKELFLEPIDETKDH